MIFLRTVIFVEKHPHRSYQKVSGGKKCSFFGKCGVLCFLETPVLRFALLPYYRRDVRQNFQYTTAQCWRDRTKADSFWTFLVYNLNRIGWVVKLVGRLSINHSDHSIFIKCTKWKFWDLNIFLLWRMF